MNNRLGEKPGPRVPRPNPETRYASYATMQRICERLRGRIDQGMFPSEVATAAFLMIEAIEEEIGMAPPKVSSIRLNDEPPGAA